VGYNTAGNSLLFNKYMQPSKAAFSLATSWLRTAFSCSSAKQRCIPETVHVALLLSRIHLTKPRLFQDKHVTCTTVIKCPGLCFSHCGGTILVLRLFFALKLCISEGRSVIKVHSFQSVHGGDDPSMRLSFFTELTAAAPVLPALRPPKRIANRKRSAFVHSLVGKERLTAWISELTLSSCWQDSSESASWWS
jgi:hypothetical protein